MLAEMTKNQSNVDVIQTRKPVNTEAACSWNSSVPMTSTTESTADTTNTGL